jgi:hypothetical protein
VNDIIKKLYESVKSFAKGMESVVGMNDEVGRGEINELKSHLTEKLNKGDEVTDNSKLIQLLDILSKDQSIMHVIKDDAEDWLEMLEAIENNIKNKGELNMQEKKEVKQINKMTSSIKDFLRKD